MKIRIFGTNPVDNEKFSHHLHLPRKANVAEIIGFQTAPGKKKEFFVVDALEDDGVKVRRNNFKDDASRTHFEKYGFFLTGRLAQAS